MPNWRLTTDYIPKINDKPAVKIYICSWILNTCMLISDYLKNTYLSQMNWDTQYKISKINLIWPNWWSGNCSAFFKELLSCLSRHVHNKPVTEISLFVPVMTLRSVLFSGPANRLHHTAIIFINFLAGNSVVAKNNILLTSGRWLGWNNYLRIRKRFD